MNGSTSKLIRKYCKLFGHDEEEVKKLYSLANLDMRRKMRRDMKNLEPFYAKES